jgi:hypothetical protein
MSIGPLEETPDKTERRDFQRRKFRGNLEIEWGSAILKGTVRDIGPRGLFVELLPPLWIGAAFRARLNLNPELWLECTVARVEPGAGIGVTFEVREESGRAQLEALLMSLSPA